MDFNDVDKLAEYRQGARDWVEKHVDPAWAEQQRTSGSYHTPELHAILAELVDVLEVHLYSSSVCVCG